MTVLHTAAPTSTTAGYTLLIADDPAQVAAAQRLRHRIFAAEFGAAVPSDAAGLDVDEFDACCDHLIVREDTTGAVVGTYRLLPPGRLDRGYAAGEFDLAPLAPLRDDLVELGRSCVDPAHRSGAVINLMWAGIARYLHLHGLRWLGGCASVSLADGGATAASVWAQVSARHLSPPPLRVRPHRPWLAEKRRGPDAVADPRPATPPLLKGYLRLGAWVCGEPAYDSEFDVADFFVLLGMDRIHPRYLRHFLGADAS